MLHCLDSVPSAPTRRNSKFCPAEDSRGDTDGCSVADVSRAFKGRSRHLQQTTVYNSMFEHPEELWRPNLEYSAVPSPGILGHCLRFQRFKTQHNHFTCEVNVKWIQYSSRVTNKRYRNMS